MPRLNAKLVSLTLGLFCTTMFGACILYGLLFPSWHAGWLLEALVPGFHWLTIGSVLAGAALTFVHGALAGLVFAGIYNGLAPRFEARTIVTAKRAAVILLVTGLATGAVTASAAPTVAVTVQELIREDHRMTVVAGSEVQWRDAHFERVWFPKSTDAPKITKIEGGFRAVFEKPGTYRGRFTVAGGHRSTEVYPLIVVVTER